MVVIYTDSQTVDYWAIDKFQAMLESNLDRSWGRTHNPIKNSMGPNSDWVNIPSSRAITNTDHNLANAKYITTLAKGPMTCINSWCVHVPCPHLKFEPVCRQGFFWGGVLRLIRTNHPSPARRNFFVRRIICRKSYLAHFRFGRNIHKCRI